MSENETNAPIYNSNSFEGNEKDYDDDDSDDSSSQINQLNTEQTNNNFTEDYQTPVSSVASYDSNESNDYKKKQIYQSNPLSVANIVQNNESKEYSYPLQQYLTSSNFNPYQSELSNDSHIQQTYDLNPYTAALKENVPNETFTSNASKSVVPKVQAATEYLLQPPDVKSIAAAALVASNNRNRRRTRTKFEAEQINLLEAAFQKTHYPDVNLVDRLADSLKINTERISVWFQNRRARYKREKHHDPPNKTMEDPFSKDTSSIFADFEKNQNKNCEDEQIKSNKQRRVVKKVTKAETNKYDEIQERDDEDDEAKEEQEEETPCKTDPVNYHSAYPNQVYSNYPNVYYQGYPNFVHPYMFDQRYQYTNQQQQQQQTRPVELNENSLSTTSPSPIGSRSDSPESPELKQDHENYYQTNYQQNYAYMQPADYNPNPNGYKSYPANFPGIFQPYADCNSETDAYTSNQVSYQAAYYKN